MYTNLPNNTVARRGAALIIAIVLLSILGIVAGIMLPQILRARQESQLDLLRIQARQLLDDALRNAGVKRAEDPDFSGETLTFGPDCQPFFGTFQVIIWLEDDVFVAEVEFHDEQDRRLIKLTGPLS